MIKKYKKKPVVIEAIQWTGDNMKEVDDFLGMANKSTPELGLIVETLEGDLHGLVGDYVIKGVRGEFYSCRKDIFEETYEEVE